MDVWHLLDFSAVINHCINSGEGAEFEYDEISGRKVNSAEHGFSVFIEEYINPMLEIARPDQIIVAHDGGIDYRQYIFPEYKAKRLKKKLEESSGEGARQLERCKTLCKQFMASLGITQAHVKGVEGDDLLAYMCQGLRGKKRVYTVDADLLQLCDKDTQVFLKNVWVNPPQLDKETAPKIALFLHGLVGSDFPEYITLYKSLVGDTSDEYKGIHGFGEAKFKEMLLDIEQEGFDELIGMVTENRYHALHEAAGGYEKIPGWLNLITKNTNSWRTSWLLANLHPGLCEKPWRNQVTKIDWYKRVPNGRLLINTLTDAKALDLLDDYQPYIYSQWLIDADNFEESDIADFVELCKQSPCVAFDYEGADDQYPQFIEAANGRGHVDTSHLIPTGVSFCVGPNLENTFYITVGHKDSANLPLEVIRKFLEAIPKGVPVVAQNAAFELAVTKLQLGLVMENVQDTMIMSQYVDENDFSNLKHLSKRWLNFDQMTFKETIAQAGIPNATMRDLRADQVVKYGVDDSLVTAHLWVLLRIQMMLENTWGFYEAEEPLVTNVLVDGYCHGTVLDWDKLAEIKKADEETVTRYTAILRSLLNENCGAVNEKFLQRYFDFESRNWAMEAQYKFNQMPDERFAELGGTKAELLPQMVAQAVSDKKAKMRSLSEYVPYSEELVYPEFKPTLATFKKVCKAIDMPPMDAVSGKKISEWALEQGCFDIDTGETSLNDNQVHFIELLNAALPSFKSRTGKAYDHLKEFCNKYIEAKPKLVKHGSEINTGSPQQMQAALYIMLGFPVRIRSKPQPNSLRANLRMEGAPAANDIAVKTMLAEDCLEDDWRSEALECIKHIKEAETRLGLYHTPYPLWRHPDTGLIYPSIKNFGTVTGRPSGSSPNILQVSKHQQEGVMRSVFLPRKEDHCIIGIDFAGQELRILASVTKDRNLMSAYIGEANADEVLGNLTSDVREFTAEEVLQLDDLRDIHSMTASGMTQVFGLPKMSYEEYVEAHSDEGHEYHEGAKKIRKKPAKQTNFLLAYGGTPPSLATRLIIPEKKAEKMMDSTHAKYPGIAKWQKSSANFARKNGYTITAYGKRRHITNDIFSKDGGKKSRMERQVNNAEIQGCAADILKKVMTASWKLKVWQTTGAICLAPVYDEIVASVPISRAIEYIKMMRSIMNLTPPGQPVPMLADISVGHNWQAQVELGMSPTDERIQEVLDEVAPKVKAKWATLQGKFKDETE